jgi:hypothetical protein
MNRITGYICRERAQVLPCPPEIDNDKCARNTPASEVLLGEHLARLAADAIKDTFENEFVLVDDGEIAVVGKFELLALLRELLGGDFEFTELLASLLSDEVLVDEVFPLIGLAGEVARGVGEVWGGALARAPLWQSTHGLVGR